MMTAKTWDQILDPSLDSLHLTGSEAEKGETRYYAAEYATQITEVLQSCSPELLLLLKANDCLRAVDTTLGAPLSNYFNVLRFSNRALALDRRRRGPGGISSWLRYVADVSSVQLQIARFNLASWAMTAWTALRHGGRKRTNKLRTDAEVKATRDIHDRTVKPNGELRGE